MFRVHLQRTKALLLYANASSGGLVIVAKILNKYLHIELGHAITIAGGLVVNEYVGSFMRKKKICIISREYAGIQRYIVSDISRGTTLYPVKGGYSDKGYMELVKILDKQEYGKVMNYIQKKNPAAFVTVSNVNEVVGIWNKEGK